MSTIEQSVPQNDTIYFFVTGRGLMSLPACELLLNGILDVTHLPAIVFKAGAGVKQTFSKESFLELLNKELKEWGEIEDFVIHPEGKYPPDDVTEFLRKYQT